MTAQPVASAGTATAVASIFIPARLPASGAASGALLQCATGSSVAQRFRRCSFSTKAAAVWLLLVHEAAKTRARCRIGRCLAGPG